MGTYVRGSAPALPLRGGSGAEMTMNMPPEPSDPALIERLQAGAAELLARTDPYALAAATRTFGGTPEDRDAAVQWLQHRLPDCDASRVLVCPGIHSALAALISQLARPGELICVESLTYPGVKAMAAQLGVQLHALTLDDEGPSAAEFELACKTLKPKALYCKPDLAEPDHDDDLARAPRGAGRHRAALQHPDHRGRRVLDVAARGCPRRWRCSRPSSPTTSPASANASAPGCAPRSSARRPSGPRSAWPARCARPP